MPFLRKTYSTQKNPVAFVTWNIDLFLQRSIYYVPGKHTAFRNK